MLDTLPLEILGIIISFVGKTFLISLQNTNSWQLQSPCALRGLSKVCWKLYHTVAPRIYEHLILTATNEWTLDSLNAKSFFESRTATRASSHLEYVRRLRLEAPIHFVRFNRCAYHSVFLFSDNINNKRKSNGSMQHEGFLCDLLCQLQPTFDRLIPNRLHSFRYAYIFYP